MVFDKRNLCSLCWTTEINPLSIISNNSLKENEKFKNLSNMQMMGTKYYTKFHV